jgi:predicted nucleic acid-binding protein
LLDNINRGALQVENLQAFDYDRVQEVCETYEDANIGFVDAAVLAVVERLNEPKLATLDRRHFGMMRPRHVPSLALLP